MEASGEEENGPSTASADQSSSEDVARIQREMEEIQKKLTEQTSRVEQLEQTNSSLHTEAEQLKETTVTLQSQADVS